jgi:UDP-3-O-[3-hydroxymyristoyl] glucosamine N-acyltransferase
MAGSTDYTYTNVNSVSTPYSVVQNSYTGTTVEEPWKLGVYDTTVGAAPQGYPESNLETMFGPLLLPKIHAKGLSALEIASSGQIILSVNDFETMKIWNDEVSRETYFESTSNYSLNFKPADSNWTVKMGSLKIFNTTDSLDTSYTEFESDTTLGFKFNGAAFATDQVQFTAPTIIGGYLSVASNAYFDYDVYVDSNLEVLGNTAINSNLSVGGLSFLHDAVYMTSTLSVTDKVFLDDDAILSSDLSVSGNLKVDTDTALGGQLSVNGLTFMADNVVMDKQLSVGMTADFESDVFIEGTLSVTGTAHFSNMVNVENDVKIRDDLSVGTNVYIEGPTMVIPHGLEADRPTASAELIGAIYFNEDTKRFEGLHDVGSGTQNLKWLGFGSTSDIDADTFITAELTDDDDVLRFYAGDSNAEKMLISSDNWMSVATQVFFDSNIIMEQDLSVFGNLNVNNGLSVANGTEMNGDVLMKNNLSVLGDTVIHETLSMGGTIYADDPTLAISFSGPVKGTNDVEILGQLSVQNKATFSSEVIVGDYLSVGDDIYLASNLYVGSNLSVSGEAFFDNSLSVQGTLDLIGKAELHSTLSVEEQADFVSDVRIGGLLSLAQGMVLGTVLSVANDALFQDDVYIEGQLSVKGPTILNNTLSVRGIAYLASNLSVEGYADVVGRTNLGDTLSVTGATTLASSLSVHGTTTLKDEVSIGSDTYIHKNKTLFLNKISSEDRASGLPLDIEMTCRNFKVNGDLQVSGTFENIETSTTSLLINDKAALFAIPADFDHRSDTLDSLDRLLANSTDSGSDKAGIKVFGIPSTENIKEATESYPGKTDAAAVGATTTYNDVEGTLREYYQKSFLWNKNGGMLKLGYLQDDMTDDADCRDEESYWELMGGAFHLSGYYLNDVGEEKKITYGFRINQAKELELIKKDGDTDAKRVAKFGIKATF